MSFNPSRIGLFVSALSFSILLLLPSYGVNAASSGCYRWHSCPSATGSYVCGDTGYCSGCSDNSYCSNRLPRAAVKPPTATSTTPVKDDRFIPSKPTKSTGCKVNGPMQDQACTPGAVLNVTAKQVCKSGYSKSVRNVSTKIKNQIFREYGIKSHPTGAYEVDHLISLELGGSNDVSNLWPEAAKPTPGFHEKDKVENYLHAQVCKGAITLGEAQKEIAINWLGVLQAATIK